MHSERKHTSSAGRVIRGLISVVVITAFVLGISYSIKSLYEFKPEKLAVHLDPLLAKVGTSTTQIGEVAGAISKRLDANIDAGVDTDIYTDNSQIEKPSANEEPSKNISGQFAILSDIEGRNDSLVKSLSQLSAKGINTIIILGDLTSYGEEDKLIEVKNILANSGMTYFTIPGDHDLAASVDAGDSTGLKYYKAVFGDIRSNIAIYGLKILMLNNSANHTVISQPEFDMAIDNIGHVDLVAMSQPIYNPVLQRSMGLIDGVVDEPVKAQADEILSAVRKSAVRGIFSGDLHMEAEYTDPENQDLKHYYVGSITDSPSIPSPRYSIVTVYADKSFVVTDTELN